eukprot:jgi/Picsp_1/2499/NSC_00730-R1_clathrin assembly factor-like protein
MGLSDRFKLSKQQQRPQFLSTKDVDIAVQKATRAHLPEDVPKEKHVVALKMAVPANGKYVAFSLLKRLHDAKDWVSAVKAALVIHRLMKETEGTVFMDEICQNEEKNAAVSKSKALKKSTVHPLGMDSFLDSKTKEGKFDYSEWVRAYCRFLDETLDVYFNTGWYSGMEKSGTESRMRTLDMNDLLDQLPRLQRIQRRLVDCLPKGAARQNDNTLLALSFVVQESFKLYKAISEGIINLADTFFKMSYLDGMRAQEVYNEAVCAGEALKKYHAKLQQMDAVKRVMEFPEFEVPPDDFLETMQEHLLTLKKENGSNLLDSKPLRKGKASKLNFSPPDIGAAAIKVDPGMIIAPLSRQTSEVSESQVEHVSSIPVKIEEEIPKPLQSSLLEFEEDLNREGTNELKAEQPQTSHEVSDLDLLTELDFDAFHVGTEQPAHSASNTPQSTFQPPSASPIPDAFVMQAAGDMYPEIRDGRAVSMAQNMCTNYKAEINTAEHQIHILNTPSI